MISVRVVRDKVTRKGIGIGYVRFADKNGNFCIYSEMFTAFKSMNGTVLKGRTIRVKRAVEKAKLEKKISRVVNKHMNKKGVTAPRDPKKMWKVTQSLKRKGNNERSE